MALTIYGNGGLAKATIEPDDSSTQTQEIQGEDVVTLSFTLSEHVDLEVNDYIDFGGSRYWLMENIVPEQKSTVEWKYGAKFYGASSLIKRFLVLKRVDGENEPVFTLTAPPREHVAMIVECINDGMGNVTDWKVGQVDGIENIVIDYEGKYCDEALKEVAEKVGGKAEWWIDGETLNITRCEHGDELTLGYRKGLVSISPDTADNVKIYTGLFPVGSSRNIDPEKYGSSRLRLPDGARYVEINTDKYGIIDHYEEKAFAGIYPRRIGTVSSVRSEEVKGEDGRPFTIYYFRDKDLNFNPNDYELAGKIKRVSFQEGSELAGLGDEEDGTYYFECNYNDRTGEFEIITIWPYDDDMQLPGNLLVPKAGDKYILWNLRMPDEYYSLAEEEFLGAVNKYNEENGLDVTVFKAATDHVWIDENDVDLSIGRRVRLESEQYFPGSGYRESRIIRITRRVNLPSSMDIEIGDVLSRTSLQKMSDNINDTRSYAKSLAETVALPDIIRTGDNTKETDQNLLSALRTVRQFLRKDRADRTGYLLGSDEGFEVGKFLAGTSGGRIAMDKDSGHSYAELDRLYVRVRAYFESLTVIEREALAGEQQVTPGGGVKCTSVVAVDSEGNELDPVETPDAVAYRCYFLSEQDGEKRETKIIAGDQVIAQTWNAGTGMSSKVSNRRWWRLVTGVSNDARTDDVGNHYGYVEVSRTDCESGSDMPEAGDEIVQFGNRNDSTRQSAIVISTVSSDAPSVKLYTGIGSGATDSDHYSLKERDVISYGYDHTLGRAYMRCYGDLWLGSRDDTSFVRYDAGAKKWLFHNVSISIDSTIGDKRIDEFINNVVESNISDYEYLKVALVEGSKIDGGLFLSTLISLGTGGLEKPEERETWAGMNGAYLTPKSIASWWGGEMVDRFYLSDGAKRATPLTEGYAAALVRMEGSAYFSGGNVGFEADGSGWLGDKENGIRFANGTMTFGSGVRFDVTNVNGLKTTLDSIGNFQIGLQSILTPVNAEGKEISWEIATQSDGKGGINAKALKANIDFYSVGGVSALGNGNVSGSVGGGSYGLMKAWTSADPGKNTNDALAANLGYDLHTRVKSLEGGSALSVTTTGTGNAVTAIAKSGTAITVTKGATFLTSHQSLADYLKKTDAATLYQPKGNYLTRHQDISHLLSKTDADAKFALRTITVSAGTGLTGGGNLTANRTLSLATSGVTAGTYTKLTVDAYGRVTSGASLSATDIPTLPISKITGLQTALDGKLDKTTFNDLFEKVSLGNGEYAIKAKYGFYSVGGVSALGNGNVSGSGGGGSYGLMKAWTSADPGKNTTDALAANLGYDLHTRVKSLEGGSALSVTTTGTGNAVTAIAKSGTAITVTKGATFLTSHQSLADYLKKTDAATLYQPKGNYLTRHQDISHLLSKTDADAKFALRTITVSAGTGLTGGGNLTANRTLSLATSGVTAGTYTKLTVDAYGRVTSGASLSATDIPTLPISKITGLQTALDGKLDKTTFNDLFEKVSLGNGEYAIKAKYSFYSVGGVSALGNGNVSGSGGGGSYGLMKAWTSADPGTNTTDALAANLGYDLHTRVKSLEGGSALSVTTTGTGNAVTAIAKSGTAITVTKGATFLTSHQSLADYLKKTDAATLYQPKGNYLTRHQDISHLLSKTDADAKFALRTITVSAGTGLTGGGNLTANRTLSLATSGVTAGTYTKLTVDAYGRVTSGASLSATDIPTLPISKITGLQTALDGKLDKTTFNDLFEKVSLGNGEYAIKAKYGFYSVGGVSALGNGNVSGSVGGSSSYPRLDDWSKYDRDAGAVLSAKLGYGLYSDVASLKSGAAVSVTTTGTGNAVTAITKSGTAITVTKGTTFLTSHQSLANYVNLNGAQTISGQKTFSNSIVIPQGSYIYGKNETSGGILFFDGTRTVIGSVGATSTAATHLRSKTGHLTVGTGNSGTYNVLDSGNYSTYALPKSSYTAADVLAKLKTVDGSGSGIDADLLDGHHRTSLEGYYKTTIDAIGLDANTWYPVTMAIGNSLQTRIRIEGSTDAPGAWNTREDKRMALMLDYTVNGSSYGWTSAQRVVHKFITGAGATGNPVCGLGQLTNSSTEYVYVRGGAKYDFYTSRVVSPTLRTASHSVSSQSVAPTTTQPALITRNDALTTDNVASATKLQTARTLWGKSFNGTANVSGDITGTGNIIPTTTHASTIGTSTKVYERAYLRYIDTDSGYNLRICVAGTEKISVHTNGNVGIGQTAPAYNLDVTGTLRTTGQATLASVRIGDCTITWDSASKALKFNTGIYSTGGVSALGNGNVSGSGSGSSYSRLDGWTDYTADKSLHVLSAKLGYDLYTNKADKTQLASYIKTDGTNGTAPGVTALINKLTEGDSNVTDSTLFVTSHASTPAGNNYYRRKATFVWNYIKGKTDALYLKLSGGSMANTNLVTNLNADLLDGLHASRFTRVCTGRTLETGTKYILLGTLPTSSSSTFDSLHITGDIGGFGGTEKAVIDIYAGRRNGVGIRGFVTNQSSATWDIGVNAAGQVYLILKGQYVTYNLNLFALQATIDWTGNTSTPTDTTFTLLSASTRISRFVDATFKGTADVASKLGSATVGSGVKPIYLSSGTATASSSTVGAANRPVYMNAGTITAAAYTFGNANGNAPISNGTVNTNLNADLLDGRHLGCAVGTIPWWQDLGSYSLIGVSDDDSQNYQNLLKRIVGSGTGDKLSGYALFGTFTPNSQRLIIGRAYNNTEIKNDYPRYSYFLSLALGGRIKTFGSNDGTYYENSVAFITDNVASASKLQTARTLWGKSFDGTANVTGNLTSVGNITGSAAMTIKANGALTLHSTANIALKANDDDTKSVILNASSFKPYDAATTKLTLGSTTARWATLYATGGNFTGEVVSTSANAFRAKYGSYGFFIRQDGANTYFMLTAKDDAGGTYNSLRPFRINNESGNVYIGNSALYVVHGGNVGVGTTSPSYKLHVSGTLGVTGLITASASGIKIGDATISWDSASKALKVDRSFYSTGGVSALGSGSASGSGGSSFGLMKAWPSSDPGTNTTDALGANLGYNLHTRVKNLEGGSALSVNTTGSGNAVTAITKSGTAITVTKGTTFLTSHQSLDHINSLGRLTAQSGTTKGAAGLRMYEVYNNGYPVNYGNLIKVQGSSSNGGGELLLGWLTTDTDTGRVLYRSQRDGSSNSWTPWKTVAWTSDIPTSMAWTAITGKPTTLSGYGITDGITAATAASTYVKKAGDTMTGALQINIDQAVRHLGFGRAGYNYITATAAGGVLAFVTNGKAAGAAANCDLIIQANKVNPGTTNLVDLGESAHRWKNVYSVLGNFSGQITSSVATGTKPLNVTSTTLCDNLNADRLDNYHKESFESYCKTTIDATGLDANTWYPVTMAIGNSLQTRIRIEGSNDAPGAWNTRTDKRMALMLDYTVNGSSYGWTSAQRVVHKFITGAGATGNPVCGLGQLTNSSTEYVYVRGGAKYDFYTSRFITPTLRTASYTVSSQSIAPTTTQPALITRNDALTTDNVASATKLQTSRTLWGQSFNGTANVSGTLSSVGSIGFTSKDASNIGSAATNAASLYANMIHSGNSNNLWLGASETGVIGFYKGANTSSRTELARITNAGNLTLAISGAYLQATNGNRKVRFSGQGVTLIHDQSSAFGMVACASDTTTVLARVCGSYAVNDALKWTYYGGTYDSPAIAILGNKNVGIGTTAPTTKLDVNGAIHANGWIGTTGNVGWKSDTHGGGIYMADATWVRTYNGKAFYTAGGTIRSDGRLQCGANSEFSVDKDGNLSSTKLAVRTNTGTGDGISLYNGVNNIQSYGILFGKTATFGTHAGVNGDWATYFTMDGGTDTAQRGWIFRHKTGGNVASITQKGAARFMGKVHAAYFQVPLGGGITQYPDDKTGSTYWYGLTITTDNYVHLNGYKGIKFRTASITAEITQSGGFVCSGGVTCLSDMRHKTVVSQLSLRLDDIAKAPSFRHVWNDRPDRGIHVGSSAQYWQRILPQVVEGGDTLSLDYGKAALLSVISVAKETLDLKGRVAALERENRKLKELISTGNL